MDLTPLFKACIKTVKTRNKAFGIQSPVNEDKHHRILRSKPNSSFLTAAKDITSQVTRLRDFLLEHRERYLSFVDQSLGDEMSDEERDQIDAGAERIINTCSHLLKEFRNDNRKLTVSKQTREYMDAVIDLVDSYLKAVCKIHGELKALRVKRSHDLSKLAVLDHSRGQINLAQPFLSSKTIAKSDSTQLETTEIELMESVNLSSSKNTLNLSESEVAVMSDEGDFSPEELQMYESENMELLTELSTMREEVKTIETKVLQIAELQEIFTEKVLQQEQDIDRIATTVVGATENVKDANEQIKQAIQRNAGLRVYILFFLLVMSFTLLFLDWYND